MDRFNMLLSWILWSHSHVIHLLSFSLVFVLFSLFFGYVRRLSGFPVSLWAHIKIIVSSRGASYCIVQCYFSAIEYIRYLFLYIFVSRIFIGLSRNNYRHFSACPLFVCRQEWHSAYKTCAPKISINVLLCVNHLGPGLWWNSCRKLGRVDETNYNNRAKSK